MKGYMRADNIMKASRKAAAFAVAAVFFFNTILCGTAIARPFEPDGLRGLVSGLGRVLLICAKCRFQ